MIDIHCHILPSMDDGASSMEESQAMAHMAWEDGIRTIVATPHVKTDIPEPALIRDKLSALSKRLEQQGIPLEILFGGDVAHVLPVDVAARYTINKTSYILLEFPHSHLPANAEQVIFEWQLAGLRPIITHPERNPSLLNHPDVLERLVAAGALVQITAGSLTGGFGRDVQSCTEYLLCAGWVHVIASDGHGSQFRQPRLSAALHAAARLVGEPAASKFVEDNPAAIIAGEKLHV